MPSDLKLTSSFTIYSLDSLQMNRLYKRLEDAVHRVIDRKDPFLPCSVWTLYIHDLLYAIRIEHTVASSEIDSHRKINVD